MVAFVFQIFAIWKPTWVNRLVPMLLLGLGVITSILAGISGQDAATMAITEMILLDFTRNAIETHERFANFTIWGSLIFLIGWLYLYFAQHLGKNYPKNSGIDYIALAFLFLLSLSVGITGYLGGELVMRYGVGVGQ